MEKYPELTKDRMPNYSTDLSQSNTNYSENMMSCLKLSSNSSCHIQQACKRSFDVAFLTAPDEKVEQKCEPVSTVNLVDDLRKQEDVLKSCEEILHLNGSEFNGSVTVNAVKHCEKLDMEKRFDNIHCDRELLLIDDIGLSGNAIKNWSSLASSNIKKLNFSHIHNTKLDIRKGFNQSTIFHGNIKSSKILSNKECGHQWYATTHKNHANCTYNNEIFPNRSLAESKSAFTKVSISLKKNNELNRRPVDRTDTSEELRASIQAHFLSDKIQKQNINKADTTSRISEYYVPFPIKMNQSFLIKPDIHKSTADNLTFSQLLNSSKIHHSKLSPLNCLCDFPLSTHSSMPCNTTVMPAMFQPLPDTVRGHPFISGLSSYAALVLPTQNVCAKCNLSFRMTSDLVYHMRSHHKNENVGDNSKKRREEKLRCSVCEETFRERHHLTRHMTAHQDKESDAAITKKVQIKNIDIDGTIVRGK